MARKLQQITRQDWPRIGFVITLAFFAGAIFYLRHEGAGVAVPLPLITGALYALIIAPFTVAVFAFLPSLKKMVECLALSRLSLSLLVFAFPKPGAFVLSNPLILAFLVVTGGVLINRMLRSDAPFFVLVRSGGEQNGAFMRQCTVPR